MEIKNSSLAQTRAKTRLLVISAMLTALSVVIPLLPLPKIIIEPFSATPASHLPAILSMFISPYVCVCTSIGSAVGFLIALGSPVIALRAFSHIIFTLVGFVLIKRNVKLWLVLPVTMLLHGASEAVVAMIYGSAFLKIWMTVGVYTMIHHCIDFAISMVVLAGLKRAKLMQ